MGYNRPTYTPSDHQKIMCGCGTEANCLVTGYGWMCKECFDELRKEKGWE